MNIHWLEAFLDISAVIIWSGFICWLLSIRRRNGQWPYDRRD